MSSRDFVLNEICNEEPDGTVIVCASSDHCDYQLPPKQGIVRAETPISGMWFKPNPKDPANKTLAYMINEVDPKAALPDFAMRQVMKDQGYQIERLRRVVPKWKKLFPGDKP